MNRIGIILVWFIAVAMPWSFMSVEQNQGRVYFVSAEGNDLNSGLSVDQAWASIERVSVQAFSPGDTVYFRAGDAFTGTLQLGPDDAGSYDHRLVVTSYGKGKARIHGLDSLAVQADSCHFLTLENLEILGNGRKSGNTTDGILVTHSQGLGLNDLEVHGFQHSGIHLRDCDNAFITRCFAHDNGFAGIHVSGSTMREADAYDNDNLHIAYCVAKNNPGDPTVLENHSGNGILASSVRGGIIEYCEASDNGWDMPWTGNGPVGIWIWDATDMTIQYCISHHNRTNPAAADGGGFDLDGGVSHSVIQYCIAHNNEGAGYGLYEFGAAKPWENNTIRYCISYNDGTLNGASMGIWKNEEAGSLRNCQIYNNTFYNSLPDRGNLWLYDHYPGIQFRNNVFVYDGALVPEGQDIWEEVFEGNLYWNLNGESSFMGYASLEQWAGISGKERVQGRFSGHYADPMISPFLEINDPAKIDPGTFTSFRPGATSPLIDQGLDLKALLGLDPGNRDLCGTPVPQGLQYDIGALEYR
jgi:hypothetical protein